MIIYISTLVPRVISTSSLAGANNLFLTKRFPRVILYVAKPGTIRFRLQCRQYSCMPSFRCLVKNGGLNLNANDNFALAA